MLILPLVLSWMGFMIDSPAEFKLPTGQKDVPKYLLHFHCVAERKTGCQPTCAKTNKAKLLRFGCHSGLT